MWEKNLLSIKGGKKEYNPRCETFYGDIIAMLVTSGYQDSGCGHTLELHPLSLLCSFLFPFFPPSLSLLLFCFLSQFIPPFLLFFLSSLPISLLVCFFSIWGRTQDFANARQAFPNNIHPKPCTNFLVWYKVCSKLIKLVLSSLYSQGRLWNCNPPASVFQWDGITSENSKIDC